MYQRGRRDAIEHLVKYFRVIGCINLRVSLPGFDFRIRVMKAAYHALPRPSPESSRT